MRLSVINGRAIWIRTRDVGVKVPCATLQKNIILLSHLISMFKIRALNPG